MSQPEKVKADSSIILTIYTLDHLVIFNIMKIDKIMLAKALN